MAVCLNLSGISMNGALPTNCNSVEVILKMKSLGLDVMLSVIKFSDFLTSTNIVDAHKNSAFQSCINHALSQRLTLRRILSKYFADPDPVIGLLALTSSVIAGPEAISLTEGDTPAHDTLIILPSVNTRRPSSSSLGILPELVRYLIENHGCSTVPITNLKGKSLSALARRLCEHPILNETLCRNPLKGIGVFGVGILSSRVDSKSRQIWIVATSQPFKGPVLSIDEKFDCLITSYQARLARSSQYIRCRHHNYPIRAYMEVGMSELGSPVLWVRNRHPTAGDR